jgi:hypothetical protein
MKLGQPAQQYHTDLNIVLLEEEWINPESDLDTIQLLIWTWTSNRTYLTGCSKGDIGCS